MTPVEAASSMPGDARTLAAEPFAGIRAERTRWLWDGRIPLGTATLLVGREKLGKSTLTNELAAQLSRGILPGSLAGIPADTLIVSYEDSASRTIKPRLMAADADLGRVHRVLAKRGDMRDLVSLPDDIDRIGELARETGARLVVIDPLSASLNAGIDAHRDGDIRRALAPLVALAEDRDLAVLALAHFNKAPGGDSLSRVLGSRGLTAAVRSVLAFGRSPDTEEGSPDRVLAHAACNLAPEAPSLACRIEGREVDSDDGVISTSRLVIVGETDAQADDLLVTRSHDERSRLDEAIEFLADELADGKWRAKSELEAAATAAEITPRTLQRAGKRAGIEVRREGFPSVTEWRLAVAPSTVGTTAARDVGATVKPPVNIEDPRLGDSRSRQDSVLARLHVSDGRDDLPAGRTDAELQALIDNGEPPK